MNEQKIADEDAYHSDTSMDESLSYNNKQSHQNLLINTK